MKDGELGPALGQLREALTGLRNSPLWSQIVTPKDGVLERFRPLFTASHLPNLTPEEFRPLLYFNENHHWTGLHRQVNRITRDMRALRSALQVLTDESLPIADRLDQVGGAIHGMGKGITTAILLVAHPDKYGVWNTTSEGALVKLGLWPEFPRGLSFGKRFAAVNDVLLKLANELGIDLWTLDAVFYFLVTPNAALGTVEAMEESSDVSTPEGVPLVRFGLERHLHDFLFDNWNQTALGKEWQIYGFPGDPAAGYEFACTAGRIDLLARHRSERKWLVVELKRDDTSDAVIGQVLRYIGWVKLNLADPGDEVRGLVIAPSIDSGLTYALASLPTVSAMTYQVDFKLSEAAPAAKDA